jgi:hypothetical protein
MERSLLTNPDRKEQRTHMRLVVALTISGLLLGCGDDTNKIPDDGSAGEAKSTPDSRADGAAPDAGHVDGDGGAPDGAVPCTQLCTPPGGGDMFVVPDGGMPDLTWSCTPFPTSCGIDQDCLIKKLCPDVGGYVDLKTCTFGCYYR